MRTLLLDRPAEGAAASYSATPRGACDAALTPDAQLARFARDALIEEARLTPKPALVDARGSGAHVDLDLATMLCSAHALEPTFEALARASRGATPGHALRTDLARIGRAGEAAMLRATGGSNAHRGAIWIVGLLVAGATISHTPPDDASPFAHAAQIAETAAHIARFDDLLAPAMRQPTQSNGERVRERYNVGGARREAQDGFPHVIRVGLPALHAARAQGRDEAAARVDALLAIMASLDDTCVLHRAGLAGREAAQTGAKRVRDAGGIATRAGRAAFDALERALLALNASPGGAADLLAATLFIEKLVHHRIGGRTVSWNN
ncbi:2-(5''-triphosphoribosyl)-3'-dephosphocoenzyme-A synthase [Paraburkholderia caffeinitolerans]|uniref:Probable 2-(5''-triphosphoribosyl)-3'-dephosphocoenzyme-A synthase n=1 Tax=Paraburkholderia caffeinitolerans TaxID=1723730 RepID=A0A6J5GID4_9BURK|nr:triphosphoribosyl-dephospho-CoA synthase [Paraburkholderia caffeinitolerans]CAB3797546.1 2-(5''-triphosphoribosyl)-3'-dephosphocoenzyme-A synthase [Paraburkholderia caffeinitolerans]